MANYISKATGNLSAAASWANCEAGAGSAQLTLSGAVNTAVAYATAVAFTVTLNDVLIGVAMHCKQTTTTGTVTVGISADNGATWAREVTVNATDLPTNYSWVLFLFGSTLTGDGGNDYKVSFKGSSAGNATFYRSATANDWAKLLALNTSPGAAPIAADRLFVLGTLAGGNPGTLTSYTITMDDTTSIDFGQIDIGVGGSLVFGVADSTAYTLKISGDLNVWAGGTYTQDLSAHSTSTGILNFDCGSNVQYGLNVKAGSTVTIAGAAKTTIATTLTADRGGICTTVGTAVTRIVGQAFTGLSGNITINAVSYTIASVTDADHLTLTGTAGNQTKVTYIPAGTTVLTVADTTGWATSDVLGIGATLNAAECESGTILTVDSATQVTLTSGLAAQHSGTSPILAPIINLTRNVKVYGASATFQTYVNIATAAFTASYAELYWMGSSTGGKRGIDISNGSAGDVTFEGCAVHDFVAASSYGFNTAANEYNVALTNNVVYNITGYALYWQPLDTCSVTGNVFIKSSGGLCYVGSGGLAFPFTGNTICGSAGGASYGLELDSTSVASNTLDDTTVLACAYVGLGFTSAPGRGSAFDNIRVYNAVYGIMFANNVGDFHYFTWTNCDVIVPANGRGLFFSSGDRMIGWSFVTCQCSAYIGSAVANGGFMISGAHVMDLLLLSCTVGQTSGLRVAFGSTYGDISIAGSASSYATIRCENTTLGSPVRVVSLGTSTQVMVGSEVRVLGGTVDETYRISGCVRLDTVIYKAAAPSERLVPTYSDVKLESSPIYATVNSGGTVTFSVWVRKSQLADTGGQNYGGNEPRLILKRNIPAGILADAILDTMTAGLGTWEQLSGTTDVVSRDTVLAAVVDCDGTAGWVNVDD